MRPAIALIAATVLLAMTSPTLAKNDKAGGPPGHAKAAKVEKGDKSGARAFIARPRFTAVDDTTVRVYFASKPVVWTGLPPGIAKNYARGKPLPPGIAKKVLPADLLARLPVRAGYEYVRVGQDVVLIETATHVVVDIIERVFG